MAVNVDLLSILHYPEPVLRQKARRIERVDDEVRAVADRMIALMREVDGAGLAAPQVGLAWRLFVTAGREEGPPDRVFINPEMTIVKNELVVREEGCLSVPGLHVNIRRPIAMQIAALDREGNEFTLQDDDFDARVWQHEFDHLEGVLIIDRMSPMDRLASRKLLKEMRMMWEQESEARMKR